MQGRRRDTTRAGMAVVEALDNEVAESGAEYDEEYSLAGRKCRLKQRFASTHGGWLEA